MNNMTVALKIIGMSLIMLCTTSIGISLARTLTGRVEELENAIAILNGIESELSYSMAPPDEIIGRLEERESMSGAAYLPCCASLCRQGIPFPEAWKRAVKENRGLLVSPDIAVLAGLSDTLGQCDLNGQLASISHAKTLLQIQANNARVRCASHARLYRTMGLLTGAFLVVIFL